MGGEKRLMLFVLRAVTGSPPRGREKVKGTGQIAVRSRITPAWAGKSRFPVLLFTGGGDHPRVGGEKDLTTSGAAF